MRAYFRQSMTALAVLLIGATVATAFPIQNFTATQAPGTLGKNQGATVKLIGASGALGAGGLATSAGGFTTTTTRVDNSDPPGSPANDGYTGNLAFTGSGTTTGSNTGIHNYGTYRTYCMELTGTLSTTAVGNLGITTKIEAVPPAGALIPQDGTLYVSDSAAAAQRVTWMIANAGNILTSAVVNSAAGQAAIQLAIWEIMYDAGASNAGDVATGVFSIVGGAANNAITKGYAASLLSASVNRAGSGWILRQGIRFNDTVATNAQTLITAVPEPSALAIAGLGALGFLGYGLRRRVKKA